MSGNRSVSRCLFSKLAYRNATGLFHAIRGRSFQMDHDATTTKCALGMTSATPPGYAAELLFRAAKSSTIKRLHITESSTWSQVIVSLTASATETMLAIPTANTPNVRYTVVWLFRNSEISIASRFVILISSFFSGRHARASLATMPICARFLTSARRLVCALALPYLVNVGWRR